MYTRVRRNKMELNKEKLSTSFGLKFYVDATIVCVRVHVLYTYMRVCVCTARRQRRQPPIPF